MKIMLNPATTALAQTLEGLNAQEEISLEAMAKAGKKIRTAKAQKMAPVKKAAAKKKAGFLSKIWGGVTKAAKKGAGMAGKLAKTGTALAGKFGVSLPGQKELLALKDIKGKISSISFKAKTFGPGGTIHTSLLKRKSPETDVMAEKLSTMARQVSAQCTAVLNTVSSAIAEGDKVFGQAAQGKIAAGGIGVFLVRHKQAVDQFRQLELKSNSMTDQYQGGLQKSDKGPEVAQEVARIARETVSEAGGKAVAFAQETGKIAEEIATQTGEGVKKGAAMLKYLPYIAVAGAALYIFTMAGGPAKMLKGGK